MSDDIKALREEISRLRERVAVLEARPSIQPQPAPYHPLPSIFPPPVRVGTPSPLDDYIKKMGQAPYPSRDILCSDIRHAR